jgi:hypothetical protein
MLAASQAAEKVDLALALGWRSGLPLRYCNVFNVSFSRCGTSNPVGRLFPQPVQAYRKPCFQLRLQPLVLQTDPLPCRRMN